MGPFLLWGDRQKNVRWFMDEFTEIKARFPNLRKVHFIGHSNGTYVLASALRNYKTLKVGNVAFGGCVLRRNFDWDSVQAQFDSVRNYVGSSDWVVGWFPALFERPLFDLVNRDIGSAGFDGFTTARGNALETRFLNGAHSVALDARNIGSIVEYIVNNKKVVDDALLATGPTLGMEYSSKFCLLIWVFIVLGALVGFFLWTKFIWIMLIKPHLPSVLQPYDIALAAVTFALLVATILRTA